MPHILENLDVEKRDALLEQIPKGPRGLIIQALEFPEMSAGRLMQRDYVAVPRYWNVGQVIDFLRGSKSSWISFILSLLLIQDTCLLELYLYIN